MLAWGLCSHETLSKDSIQIDVLLTEALQRLSLRDAVNEISILTGMQKKQVYHNALAIINSDTQN